MALLVVCLVCMSMLSACTSGEPSASKEASEEQKCAVQIFIDCEQNLFFSKYNVDVSVDGEQVGNVEHGGDATFEVNLAKGQHELTLNKEDSSAPEGKASFVVESEGDEFAYRISCEEEQIGIELIKEEDLNSPEGDTDDDTLGEQKTSEGPVGKEKTAEEEKTAAEAETAKRAEEEAETAERAALDGCVGDTAAHARDTAVSANRSYSFKYARPAYGLNAGKDVESGDYEGAMQRAKVTEVSYELFGDVIFMLDRPLAVSAEDDEELQALLQLEAPNDDTVYPFYKKYWGKNIEFDGQIQKVTIEGSEANPYYTIVISPVDHDSGKLSGPAFRFEYVRPDDLCWEGGDLSAIVEGADVHVIAEIKDYNGVRKQIELKSRQISPL